MPGWVQMLLRAAHLTSLLRLRLPVVLPTSLLRLRLPAVLPTSLPRLRLPAALRAALRAVLATSNEVTISKSFPA